MTDNKPATFKQLCKLKLGKLNWFLPFRLSGGKVIFIAENLRELHSSIKYKKINQNFMGCVYGGCAYAAVDPIYPLMLQAFLGGSEKITVYNKSSVIRFKRPITKNVFAKYELTEEVVQRVTDNLAKDGFTYETYIVKYVDENLLEYISFELEVYVAYKNKHELRVKNNETSIQNQ